MNSKFSGIFAARNANPAEEPAAEIGDEQPAPSPAPAPPIVPETPGPEATTKEAAAAASTQARKQRKNPAERSSSSAHHPPPPADGKRPGRPPGKRSDPTYGQVTAYLRRSTYSAVQIALLKAEEGQEFSVLVEELLAKWLKSRT